MRRCSSWRWVVGLSRVLPCDFFFFFSVLFASSQQARKTTNSEGKQRRCTGAYSSWLMKGSQIWCRLARRWTASSVNINFPWRGVLALSPGTLLDILDEVAAEGCRQTFQAAKLKRFINGIIKKKNNHSIQSVFGRSLLSFYDLFLVLIDAIMLKEIPSSI